MEDSKKLYSIIRIKKLNKRTLLSADKHNKRKMNVPNADGTKKIKSIYFRKEDASETLLETAYRRMDELNVSAKRKDAIFAIELLLTATPEYFIVDKGKPFSLDNADKVALQKWYQKSIEWLKVKFKKTLLQAQLHLDESSPHIHAFFLPVIEKVVSIKHSNHSHENSVESSSVFENKLCAKGIVTKSWLYTLHDEYAGEMKSLGLKRGKLHSQAKHSELKEYAITSKKIDSQKRKLLSLENDEKLLKKNKEKLTLQGKKLEKTTLLLQQEISELKEQVEVSKSKEKQLNNVIQKMKCDLVIIKEQIFSLNHQKEQALKEGEVIKQKLHDKKQEVDGLEAKYDKHFVFFKQVSMLAKTFTEEVVNAENLLANFSLPLTLQKRLLVPLDKMKKLYENYLVGSVSEKDKDHNNYQDIPENREVITNSPVLKRMNRF